MPCQLATAILKMKSVSTERTPRRPELYLTPQNPTELYYQRHELLLQVAHDRRLGRQLRAARRKGAPEKGSGKRSAGFLQRVLAL